VPTVAVRPAAGDARGFARLFAGLVAFWIVGQASFNWLVNPWGLYRTKLFEARVTDERHQKTALMHQMQPPPNMLIVGSSRMMRVNPMLIAERTGLRPFNAAIPGAYPIDFYVMYRFATEELHAPLEQLLVGVDPLIFFGGEGSYRKIENNAELRRLLPSPSGLSSDIGQLSLLVSPAQSKDGLKSLLHLLRPARRENTLWRVFEPDGWQSRNYQDAKREAGKWDQTAIVEKQLKGWYMNPKKAPTPATFTDLEALLARAAEQGVRTTVVATPTSARVKEHWRDTGFADQERQIRARLAEIAGRHGARFADYSSVENYGGDPNEFYDTIHPTAVNTRLIVEALFPQATAH
jgi:hypothetical protein